MLKTLNKTLRIQRNESGINMCSSPLYLQFSNNLFVEVNEDINIQLNNLKLDELTNILESKSNKTSDKPAQLTTKIDNEAVDPEKKLKNLKKRLREIESLEEKVKNGTLAKPEPEQLTKIKRKNDLLLQIHDLEKQLQQIH